MKDRVPSYPGRVQLTQVSGNIYDLEMADQPTEQGTPLNKATLLQDSTAELYGFSTSDNATPDDIFNAALDVIPTVHLNNVFTDYGPQRHDADAISVNRSYLAGASVGGNALFAGGRKNDNSFSDVVDTYNTSMTHSTATSLSTARYMLSGASIGNYALFVGGSDDDGASDVVDAYDSALTHSTPTVLGEARSLLANAHAGSYVIFAGGNTRSGNISSFVDAYDSSLTHMRLLDLLTPRSDLAGASVGGYAIFAGGAHGTFTYYALDTYNGSLTRSTAQTLSMERYALAGASAIHTAFFAGGTTGSSASDIVDAYNESLTRMQAPTLSVPRYSLVSASLSNYDYAVFAGGETSGYNKSDVIDIYTSSLTHTTKNLSVARDDLASANVGDKVLFSGGETSSGKSNATDLYTVEYGLSIQIPAWSKYNISNVTSGEVFTKDDVSINATSDAPFSGYIKRGFTISGKI